MWCSNSMRYLQCVKCLDKGKGCPKQFLLGLKDIRQEWPVRTAHLLPPLFKGQRG